jgi:hypothetical protein
VAQPLQEKLADPPGICRSARSGHHRADERPERALVAGADLLRGVGVGGDGRLDGCDQLVLARDLPPVRLDHRIRLALTGGDRLGHLAGE